MKKIIIIEDDKDILDILKIALEDTYKVKLLSSAKNIVNEIQEFSPNLIIIDNQVGNTSSESIITSIKTNIPEFNIPYILCSAHHEIEEKAKKIGAINFISKPFDLFDLLNTIEKHSK